MSQSQSTQVKIASNKKAKSKLWKHFGFLVEGSGETETVNKKKVVCRLCNNVSPYAGCTTNLAAHLERHHTAEYQVYLTETKSGQSQSTTITTAQSSQSQTTLQASLARSQPLSKSGSRYKELVDAVGRFISADLLPLSVVEDSGFRNLIKLAEPRFSLPSRRYFSDNVIPSLYLQEKERIESSIANAEYCSFTTDLWTAKHQNRSYISLTIHFIDNVWELRSYCLETREISVDHTAENIATELGDLLSDWKVKERVCGFTTDNGANIVNAMERLDVLNFPCLGHTLQLAVKQSFDVRAVSRMLARVRRLVKHFHKSTKSTYRLTEKQNLLDLPQHKLKGDCVTRWGSTYTMLERLLEQQQAICAVLLESEKRDVRLLMPSSEEFAVAQELTEILKTFHFATEVISGEKYPTIGIAHPLLHKLLTVTLSENDEDSSLVRQVKRAVSVNLEGRYQDDAVQKLMRCGMFLDPRFKKAPYLSDAQRMDVRSDTKDELVKIIRECQERQASQGSSSRHALTDSTDTGSCSHVHAGNSAEEIETPPRPKRTKLANLLGDIYVPSQNDAQTVEEIAESEIQRYESEPGENLDSTRPLEWWSLRAGQYKYLSKLVKKVMCVTATSVPSERIFSSAGNILCEKRSCLSPSNVNRLVFLYENMT